MVLFVKVFELLVNLLPALPGDEPFRPNETLNYFAGLIAVAGVYVLCLTAFFAFHLELVVLWAMYKFAAICTQSFFPSALAELTVDKSLVNARLGLCFSVLSVGWLCVVPFVCALVQQDMGMHIYAQIFLGLALLSAAATIWMAGTTQHGKGQRAENNKAFYQVQYVWKTSGGVVGSKQGSRL